MDACIYVVYFCQVLVKRLFILGYKKAKFVAVCSNKILFYLVKFVFFFCSLKYNFLMKIIASIVDVAYLLVYCSVHFSGRPINRILNFQKKKQEHWCSCATNTFPVE
jgi:hypothetical protein